MGKASWEGVEVPGNRQWNRGLSFALRAAKRGRVSIITKKEASESSTNYAQGGIATVWSDEDTFESHIEDTHRAGAGLCHADTVDFVVRDAPARIRELIGWGVEFTRRTGKREFDLHREGGHSARRIFHAKDLTGREVERALLVRARENPRIRDLREPRGDQPHHAAEALRLRPPGSRRGARRLRAGPDDRRDPHLRGGRDGPRHRRFGQGVPVHEQPRRRDRGRRRAGVPRRGDGRQPGVRPVPPHLPLPPARQVVPHLRGGPRRGGGPPEPRREAVHGGRPPDEGARPEGHRRAGDRRGDEAHRGGLRLPRHPLQGSRRSSGSTSRTSTRRASRSAST